MKLRTKMFLLAAVVLAGFLTSILTGLQVVRQVRVGGEIYGTIKEYKDLLENIAMLRADLNQVRAESFNLILETDPDKINQIESALSELKGVVDIRFANTLGKVLIEDKQIAIKDAQTTWQEFAATLRDEILPALRSGDRAAAQSIAGGIQRMRYERFNEQLGGLVEILVLEIEELEGTATATAQRKMLFSSVVSGVLFLVVVVVTVLIARSITRPVLRGAAFAQAVAGGDLTGKLEDASRDETGDLTRALNTMVDSLGGMVHRVGESTGQLSRISTDIYNASKRVVAAVQKQAGGVEETSSAITEIGYSIQGVGEGVERLSGSAADNTSSILEMAASIEEVAQNVEVLGKAVEEVSSSIAEMAASIREVAENASNLQHSSAVTASSINQMDVSIRQVEQNATAAAAIVEEVRCDAETGKAAVDSTIAGIQEIRKVSEVSTGVIKTLSGRVENIGSILLVIDDVVNEINLLALNAAIIAAQAGAHGKGFSVVAEEIKELADRTGLSTKEIAAVIQGVQEESRRAMEAITRAGHSIAEGEQLSQQSGAALVKIVAGAQQTSQQMAEIVRATREQTGGSRMIREAMEKVAEMVRQIAVATHQQEKGGEQIMVAAEKMKNLTAQVRSSTRQQSNASGAIARATEEMTAMIGQIKRACDEQSKGSGQIVHAIENIRHSTAVNQEAVGVMDTSVSGLGKQIETLRQEMAVFQIEQQKEAAG